ncbi:hypothetical protein [Embleya sp. NPDC005575]|uniref:hypothetical protein n=1 Tax=Embleya sp. NPDC005575 TaxID=3156892 RepID=UPI0033B809C2
MTKVEFLGCLPLVRARDARSDGPGDVVAVGSVGEVGMGVFDGIGVGRGLLVFDERAVDAGQAGASSLAFAGGDDGPGGSPRRCISGSPSGM